MLTRYSQVKVATLLAILLSITACGGSGKSSPETPPTPTSVSINVTDTNGIPLEDVSVATRLSETQNLITAATGTTNIDGSTVINEIPEESDVVFVFEKNGYAAQVKTFETPEATEPALLSVVMIVKGAPQPFDADAAAELNGRDGAYLAVEANAFVDGDGNPVSGEIELQMTPVDVSTEAGLAAFPGSYTGIPEDGSGQTNIVSLGTTEFTFSQGGEELQLAEGETAIIDMPMYVDTYPDGTAVQIGDEIPLWSLNEETGIWVQEGVGEVIAKPASPTGLAMRAEVSHFTWWNTDWYPPEEERFEITVNAFGVDENDMRTTAFDGQRLSFNVRTGGFNTVGTTQLGEPGTMEVFQGLWCFFASGNVILADNSRIYVESENFCQVLTPNAMIDIPVNISGVEFEITHNLRDTATVATNYGACNDQPRIRAKSAYPLTYTIVSGALPPGLTIENNGAVTGAPTASGQYNVQIEVAEDINGERGEFEYVIWDIDVSPELTIRRANIRPVFQVSYPVTAVDPFTAEGGLEAYTFREAPDSSTPPGIDVITDPLAFSGTPGRVLLNGTPMMGYRTNVIVEVRDQNCAVASDTYPQDTIWAPRLEGTPDTAIVGEAFSFTPTNTEGPIEEWEAVRGLPAWASFNRLTGEITGTPGRADFGVASEVTVFAHGPAIDLIQGGHGTGGLTFTLNVGMNPPIVAALNDDFIVAVGQAFSFTPTNTGEQADNWEADNLPSWLSLDSDTGEISGTPTTIATHEGIILRAVNPGGSDDTGEFTINVVAQIASPQLGGVPNNAEVDVGYGFTPNNSGGAVNQWSITGSLPNGLTFSNGTIAGTPTTAGTYSGIEITGTNAGGTDTLNLTITADKGQQATLQFVDPGPIERTTEDAAFSNGVQGGSGSGALSYQSSDTQVATIHTSNGLITIIGDGTTTITATKAEDANYLATSAAFNLNVSLTNVILGTPDQAYRNTSYSFTPSVSAGITITSWEISSGAMPQGLLLNSTTGVIAGTPQQIETTTFDLRANTDTGEAHIRAFEISVIEPPQRPNLFNDTNFDQCDSFGEVGCYIQLASGSAIDLTLDAGTPDEVTWAIEGDLPPGLSFDEGAFDGTPSSGGQFIFNVTATNELGTDTLGIFFDILQEQDPISFDQAGPIDAFYQDGTLTNTASGGNSASSIVYRSDDTSVATVDSISGEVTFVAPGSVTISATRSSDGVYLPASDEYVLNIAIRAPTIDYVYTDEDFALSSLSWLRINLSEVLGSGFTTIVYAATSLPIDPDDPDTLSVAMVTGDTTELASNNIGAEYHVAAQIFHSNGEQSEMSSSKPATTLISDRFFTGDSGTAFAYTMALAGDVLVVGNSLNDAYASQQDLTIYERIDNEWTFTQTLPALQDWWGKALDVHQADDGSYRIASGTNASSNFGNADRQGGIATYTKVITDICGNGEDDDNDGETDEVDCETVVEGTVYNNGIWVLENYEVGIYPEVIELNDNWMALGKSVSDNCDTDIFECGEVLIHRFPWDASAEQSIAAPQQRTMNFHFGRSLASDDDVLIVGAPGADGGTCFNNCGVYAYRDNGTSFDYEARLGGLGQTGGRAWGYSVAISGNTVAIGDPTATNEGGPTNDDGGDGMVYLYQKSEGDTWADATETLRLKSPMEAATTPALNFGVSLSLTNDTLIVGDQKQSCLNDDSQCGLVHIFNQGSDGSFSADDAYSFGGYQPEANDGFGFVVKADGSAVAVSQYLGSNQLSPGRVLLYTLP